MATFKVYATQMVYYVATIEAENVEDIIFNDIDFDEFKEYDSDWQTNDIEEVK